jgi:hypothetical protein
MHLRERSKTFSHSVDNKTFKRLTSKVEKLSEKEKLDYEIFFVWWKKNSEIFSVNSEKENQIKFPILLKAFIKIIGSEKNCVNHWIRSCFFFCAFLVGKTLRSKVSLDFEDSWKDF